MPSSQVASVTPPARDDRARAALDEADAGLRCRLGVGVVAGRVDAGLVAFTEQCQQIRLKAGAIFCRMPEQELDQPAFACAKMAVHLPSGKTMQHGKRLLGEKLFEFFGSHGFSLKFNTSNTGRAHRPCLRLPVHPFASRQFLQHATAQDGNRL